MHEQAIHGTHSPRGSIGRRGSTHFREIPADMIPEDAEGDEGADGGDSEERKAEDATGSAAMPDVQ